MKRSFREHIEAVNQANDFQEAMFGDLREAKGRAPIKTFELAPKREIVNHSPAHLLEASVMQDLKQVIPLHPKVFFCIRQSSGETEYGSRADPRRVRYYDWIKLPPDHEVTVTDTWGLLKSGRFFAIEAKRRDWRMKPSDYRAKRQQNFIDAIVGLGGVGGIVTCAEQALEILDRA